MPQLNDPKYQAYIVSDGKIWAAKYDDGKLRQLTKPGSRASLPPVAEIVEGSEDNLVNAKIRVRDVNHLPGLVSYLGIPPDKGFQTFGDRVIRLKPDMQSYDYFGANEPVPSDWSYDYPDPPDLDGLTWTLEERGGTLYRNLRSDSTGRIVESQNVGSINENGVQLNRVLSRDMIGSFVPPGTPFSVGDSQFVYNEEGRLAPFQEGSGGQGGSGGGQQPPGGGGTNPPGSGDGGNNGGGGGGRSPYPFPFPRGGQNPNQRIPFYDPSLLDDEETGFQIDFPAGSSTEDIRRAFMQSFRNAEKANREKFKAAYGGAAQNYLNVMNTLKGLGGAERTELHRRYRNKGNEYQQQLVRRGLSSSTVSPTMDAANERNRDYALRQLNNNLRRERLHYQTDAAKTILGVLNQRNDPYPQLAQYATISQLAGRNNG